MTRKLAVALTLLLTLTLTGCDRSMNWVIGHEPSVWGTVEEIDEHFVTLRVTKGEDFEKGSLVRVSKSTRLEDGAFHGDLRDEVAAYYDGAVKPGDIPEIYNVHGILLVTPAERQRENAG